MDIIRDDILQATAVDNERRNFWNKAFFFFVRLCHFCRISQSNIFDPKESVQVYLFVFPLLIYA
jgi:hypothetical protein